MLSCSLILWCVLLKRIWKLPLPQLLSLLFLRVMSRLEELCSQLLSLSGQINLQIEEKFNQFLFQFGTCQAAETYLRVSTSQFDSVFWMESLAYDSLLKIYSQRYLQDQEDSSIMDCLQTSFCTFFNAFFIDPTDNNLQLSFALLLDCFLIGFSSLLSPCKSLRYFTQFMNLLRSPTLSFRSSFSSLSLRVIRSLPFILFLQKIQRQAFIYMVSRKSRTSFMPHSFRFLEMNDSCANLERQQYFIRKVISSSLMLGCIFQKLFKSTVLNLSLSKLSVGKSSQLFQCPSSFCSFSSPRSYTSSYNFFFSASQCCPLPHFIPSLNSPIQQDELLIVSLPLPSCLSFCHSPSYCMFSQLQICMPRPYFMPLTHSPLQKSPFAQSIEPVPFGTPFSSSPQQRSVLTILLFCMDSLGVFMERIVAGAWTSLAGVWHLGYLFMSLVCLGIQAFGVVGRSQLQHILKRNIL